METANNVMKLLAGIGLFLFAMYLLEESLKNLSGRKFKIFLQRVSKNRIGAVSGGAIVTGLLQSSSMVAMMVLAFVGAGVFAMKNAMAIILGANLGTTLDSWVVATLGFKMNIEIAAYPAVCVAGLLLVFLGKRKTIKYFSYFLFGFGLLFIGLSFMKTAMEAYVKAFDFSQYAQMPAVVFLLIGFVITILVQSSSVVMALTLSALHAGAVGFPTAVAIVLGSETGTTIKIVLGAIGGSASKKRVVLGNLLFNIFLTITAFIFLKQLILLITDVFNVKDPLIGLVTFSTIVNLFAIIAFLPFLDLFASFLERFFKDADGSAVAFIANANLKEPETALDLFEKETAYFINNAMLFDLASLDIDRNILTQHPEFIAINEKRKILSQSPEEKYEFMKTLQGEMQAFYLELRSELSDTQSTQLDQWNSAVRNAMYAVKSFKDVRTNIINLKRSSKDVKFDLFIYHQRKTKELYIKLDSFIGGKKKPDAEIFLNIFKDVQQSYTDALDHFYKDARQAPVEDLDLTTAINFNRELLTSNRAMLMAVKDLLLDGDEVEGFNEGAMYRS